MSQQEHKTTEKEIKEIWERLTKGEASMKSAHHRIDNLEKLIESVNKMAVSINQIVTELKAMRLDVNDVTGRVEEIEKKPIKRYETVVTTILTALCSGGVGCLLGLIIH